MTEPTALQPWDRNRGQIRSRKGGWIIGRGVLNQGYEMMTDFVGKLSYMQVNIFNATGKLPSRAFADMAEAVCICLSWPDPRIWCNNIGALGGSGRASALASTAAGIMATDSKMYGIRPIIDGIAFIEAAQQRHQGGDDIPDILQALCRWQGGKPRMMGYARPIAHGDERVPALEYTREKLQLEQGPHLSLAFAIDNYLQQEYGESMNINGYVAAFMTDHQFTGEEVYRLFLCAVASGVTACYVDTASKAAGTFLPLQCGDIEYQGEARRPVPPQA